MRFRNSSVFLDLDRTLAFAGILASLILILYSAVVIGRAIYTLTGILSLISCSAWILIRKHHPFRLSFPESRTIVVLCAVCFFGLFILSILSVQFRPEPYERPLIYSILVALMGGIITLGIFSSGRRQVPLILLQVVFLGINIAWSQLLTFPSLVGVDPWYHSALTYRIIDESFIPGGYSYTNVPVFHLTIASTSMLIDLDYKLATMLSVSAGQIICNTLFIYLIASRLFKSHQIGLLAILMMIVSNHHIFMSYWSIPNGFGVVYIPIIIYILFHKHMSGNRSDLSLHNNVIVIMLMIAVILTHSIAAVSLGIFLWIIWVASLFHRIIYTHSKKIIAPLIPFGFSVSAIASQIYFSGELGRFLRYLGADDIDNSLVINPPGANQLPPDSGSIVPGMSLVDPLATVPVVEELFNNIGMFIFFTIALIGVFYMVSRKDRCEAFIVAMLGVAPLSIGFGSLLLGVQLIEHRWWYLAQVFLSIPLAASMNMMRPWKSRRNNLTNLPVALFVMILTFLLILSPAANVDCHTISKNSRITFALDHSEMRSGDFLRSNAQTSIILSDYVFYYSQKYELPTLKSFDYELVDGYLTEATGATILIRDALVDRPTKVRSTTVTLRYDPNDMFSGPNFHKIYSGNSNNIYLGINA